MTLGGQAALPEPVVWVGVGLVVVCCGVLLRARLGTFGPTRPQASAVGRMKPVRELWSPETPAL
ncbi:MAG: hypothetical protein C4332_11550 [Meiothermus sp.]